MESSPPEESQTIPIEAVQLNRTWTFWENYEAKNEILNYGRSLKKIHNFSTLIDFWQFWNVYPGQKPIDLFYNGERIRYFFNEKYRISAMNWFVEGIKPEWEDIKNKDGKIYTLEYIIQTDIELFFQIVTNAWTKLILYWIGEKWMNSEEINGLRFVDKTQFNKKIMFRFEVWISKEFPRSDAEKFKKYLGEEFGCSGITEKDIKQTNTKQ